MKFDNFVALCSTARFVNIVFANGEDSLVTVGVSASSETAGYFFEIGCTEEEDFVIRKSDAAKATPEGKGFKMTVLVRNTDAEAGENWITYKNETYVPREATVYFLGLVTLDPEKLLAKAAAAQLAGAKA